MKKPIKKQYLTIVLPCLAFVALIFSACQSDLHIETYTGTKNGILYTLEVGPIRASHAAGNPFTFTASGGGTTRISTGRISIVVDSSGNRSIFTLQPSYAGAPTFRVHTLFDRIIFIDDDITYNDGSTQRGPGSLTENGNGGGGGVLAKAPGAPVGTPTANDALRTYRSLTLNPVPPPDNGQSVEYAISLTATPPTSGWQSSLAFIELDGNILETGQTYYIFARSAENNNFYAGPPSAGLPATTSSSIIPPPYLRILDGNLTLAPGGITRELTVMGMTSTFELIDSASWSLASGESFTAEIDPSFGVLTSKNPGTVTIRATSADGQNDTITVTVSPTSYWHTDINSDGWGFSANGSMTAPKSYAYGNGFRGLELSSNGLASDADQVFSFVYVPVTGDFTMVVKFQIDSPNNPVRFGTSVGYTSVAGLIAIPQGSMTRDPGSGSLTFAEDRRNLLYASTVAPAGGLPRPPASTANTIELRARAGRGQNSLTQIRFATTATPTYKNEGRIWIKLRRQGNTFTSELGRGTGLHPDSWTSWDGDTPAISIGMGDTTYLGLWVAAGENATLNPPSGPSPGPVNTGRTIANFSDWRVVYGDGNASDSDLRRATVRIIP